MKPTRLLIVFLVAAIAAFAAEPKKSATPPPKQKQYLYLLKLVPRLHDDSAWTDDDKKTVSTHFAHLKAATADGKVIMAGRTLESGSRTFGIVVFEAADDEAATKFMNSDPAVAGKVMTATMHPYQIALQRSAP